MNAVGGGWAKARGCGNPCGQGCGRGFVCPSTPVHNLVIWWTISLPYDFFRILKRPLDGGSNGPFGQFIAGSQDPALKRAMARFLLWPCQRLG